jgi:hypothetical protein
MMSYQLMLRKMNPNKIEKVDDNEITAVPLTERTRLLELSVLQRRMDHETCNGTLMKQPTMLSAVH